MRKILIYFLLFISFNAFAEFTLKGSWEGFINQGVGYSSYLLVLDENYKGFYTISLENKLHEDFFFPVDLSDKKFKNGFIDIPLRVSDDPSIMSIHLILSRDMFGDKLNSLTIAYTEEGDALFSTGVPLVKSRDGIIKNMRLYDFGQKLYNKPMQ